MKQRARVTQVLTVSSTSHLSLRLSQACLKSSSQCVQGLWPTCLLLWDHQPESYWARWLKCSGNFHASVHVKVKVRLLNRTLASPLPHCSLSLSPSNGFSLLFSFGFITRNSNLTFHNKQTLQCFGIIFFKHGEKLWKQN